MAASAPAARTTSAVPAVPAVTVPVWAWLMVALGVLVLYLGLQDNGALLSSYSTLMHELTHDGRHALGLPCH